MKRSDLTCFRLLALFCLILAASGGPALAGPALAGPALAGRPAAAGNEARWENSRFLFRKEPYLLYRGNPTQMKLLWQLSATGSCLVEWGPDSTCSQGWGLTGEYGTDHQHAFILPNLTPGGPCFYRVGIDGTTHRGSFTAAPPASTQNLKFVAYGDSQAYPATHDSVAAAIMSLCNSDPGYRTFTLRMGDLSDNGDDESYWDRDVFSPAYPNIRSIMAHLPIQSCMGNHEGAGYLFAKYFPYPFSGGRYWSFDYGPVHIVMVDQYVDYTPGSAELQWMADDLAASSKPWKFLCLHEPGWSADGNHQNNTEVQDDLFPLCVEYGVSIVFAGHNHYYARAQVGGVQHITTGGGGGPLYNPNPAYPYVITTNKCHHFCMVEIVGQTLVFRAINLNGTFIDTFILPDPASVAAHPPTVILEPPAPNPFSTETRIAWWAPEERASRLLIADVRGRVVRSFPASGTGRQAARWDGRDETGRTVSSGIYFYRLDRPLPAEGMGRVLLIH